MEQIISSNFVQYHRFLEVYDFNFVQIYTLGTKNFKNYDIEQNWLKFFVSLIVHFDMI